MNKIIQRNIFKKIKSHLKQKEATVVIGPRQAGKTTLILSLRDYLLKEKNISPERVFYYNCDRFTDLEFFSSQEEVIKFLESRKKLGILYFFIDEAQRIKESGRFLKGIYDLGLPVKFILTGSSTLEIKSQFVEPLTGRKRVFYLYPFSFYEFLLAKNPTLAEIIWQENSLSQRDSRMALDLVNEFIVFGSYPRVAMEEDFSEKRKIIEEIFNSYLDKDIVVFLKIKKPLLFKKLVGLLAFQSGQLVNVNEICQSLKMENKTAQNYLDILQETFIIKQAVPFFSNARKELVKMPKVFFIDNGLRNFAANNLNLLANRHDHGQLLENFTASELIKNETFSRQIHFWRTQHGAEVDFVLEKEYPKILPIEVKTQTKNFSVPKGLAHFLKSYPSDEAFVVNMEKEGEKKYEKTKVQFIYPFRLGKLQF